MKTLFDRQEAETTFSMFSLYNSCLEQLARTSISSKIDFIHKTLGKKSGKHVLQGIIRAIFLIELVKRPKIESTKFATRWSQRLNSSDPRYASYEVCMEIFEVVIENLIQGISNSNNVQLLKLFSKNNLVPYEIPLDYVERNVDESLHTPNNLAWMWDDLPQKVVRLRALLTDPSVTPLSQVFRTMYRKKIQVKTYLTDRALTGIHKTNREKRWETHPASVQFAFRRDCLDIEYTLINQVCHFEGASIDLRLSLEEAGLLEDISFPFRCPITMQPLPFKEIIQEVKDPVHGKANFQVGHLNPLKAMNDDPTSGHTAQNISWISSDGNRIQGNLSLRATRQMIVQISEAYEKLGVEI